MQPIILFDVDKTLVDSTLLGQKTGALIIQECQLTEQEFYSKKEKYLQSLSKNTDFTPETFLQFVTEKQDVSQLKKKIFDVPQIYRDCVFADAKPTLKKLKSNFQLGIFSEAEENWQRSKLEMAELNAYFKKELIFISRRKTETSLLEKLPKNAIIIDDKLEVIEALVEFGGFQPIWINRLQSTQTLGVPTTTSLAELEQVISTLGKND